MFENLDGPFPPIGRTSSDVDDAARAATRALVACRSGSDRAGR
jgi:hypothetical protein